MRLFLVLLVAAGLVACGPKARKVDNRSPEQMSADAAGVPLAEFRKLLNAEKASMTGLDAVALRDGSQARCRDFRGTPEMKPCLVRQRASVELLTAKSKEVLAGDPTTACVDTRMQMGASSEEASRVCAQFSPQCRAEYAERYWRWADRVTSGLLGAEGKGYFKCKAADEVLFAGAVFRNASVDQYYRGRTSMSSDPCHGEQIEYNAPDGTAYLWYGTNATVVKGEWEIVEGGDDPRITFPATTTGNKPVPQYCQRYQGNTVQPGHKTARWPVAMPSLLPVEPRQGGQCRGRCLRAGEQPHGAGALLRGNLARAFPGLCETLSRGGLQGWPGRPGWLNNGRILVLDFP